MTNVLHNNPKPQYIDGNGDPYSGGKLYYYEAGTSTPLTVYKTAAGTAHSAPIVLNSAGRVPDSDGVFLPADTVYKEVLKTSADVEVYTIDNLTSSNGLTSASVSALINTGATTPLDALQYPTIDTSDNLAGVTSASLVNGGTVSLPADVRIYMASEVTSGETGIMALYETVAYTSSDLDVSSTYYLRGQIDGNGDLNVYVQKGTDSDSIPGSLVGTPDAESAGGFDSTVLDILFAKVVTSTAGTTPTVTKLANAKVLRVFVDVLDTVAKNSGANGAVYLQKTYTLNWARYPIVTGIQAHCGSGNVMEGPIHYYDSGTGWTDGDGTFTPIYTRYVFSPVHGFNAYIASTSFPTCNIQTTYELVA